MVAAVAVVVAVAVRRWWWQYELPTSRTVSLLVLLIVYRESAHSAPRNLIGAGGRPWLLAGDANLDTQDSILVDNVSMHGGQLIPVPRLTFSTPIT